MPRSDALKQSSRYVPPTSSLVNGGRIGHPERIAVELLPTMTFQDTETLLRIPLKVLAVCGVYLGIA